MPLQYAYVENIVSNFDLLFSTMPSLQLTIKIVVLLLCGQKLDFVEPGRFTVWKLLLTVERWQKALEVGHTLHALFLGVAKAIV